MEPQAFVAEVYRRMSVRQPAQKRESWQEMESDPTVEQAAHDYAALLPQSKDAAILDIGFGRGWFIAACLKLGYASLYGADFGIARKSHLKGWSPNIAGLYEIESNIGDFLAGQRERFDFIHMSHVIEHIPKYSLLYVVDALYWAIKPGGTLLLRTPNMEGPCANSSLYVTLAHEYGFAGSNLNSLLNICNFDDVCFHRFAAYRRTFKQMAGGLLRWPFLQWNAARHRLFGANYGQQFGAELVISAKRGMLPPLFDAKYK
jgi:2-polyprenyl-3-methyl-5-hydroxy-6-metoxy-1,4-benzoquinol methylase